MKGMAKRIVIALCALSTMVLMTAATGCNKDKCAHDWGDTATQIVKDATCMEKGEELWTCGLCGEEKIVKTDKKEHNLDPDGIVVKEPTCTSTGTLLKKCMTTDCTYEKTEAIEKIAHKRVDVPEVKPTCTEAGATEYAYCSECKTYIIPKTVLSALGHQKKTLEEVPATCTEEGLTAGEQCVLCDEILKEQVVISATGHTEVIVKGYPASCGLGYTDGIKCGNCDKWLVEQVTIPATGSHLSTATKAEVPATCTSTGLTEVTYCTACGETVSGGEEIPMTAHNLVNTYCTVCDYHEHSWVVLNAVPATCTETGKSEGRYCGVCGEVKSEQVTLPALGHGDTYQYGANVAATCTTAGSTAGLKCEVCDAIIKASTVIPVKGHVYSNGTCTVCGIEHPTHYYTVSITKPSISCKTAGTKTYTCSCGHSYTETYYEDHNWTKSSVGGGYVCTFCGKTSDYIAEGAQ